MARFCSQCGNEIKAGSKFCNKCGQPVGEHFSQNITEQKEAAGATQNVSNPISHSTLSANNNKMVMALIAVVLLIGGIGSYFLFGDRSPNGSPDMVAKTFATTVCDILNDKDPDLEVYNGLWKNPSLCQRLTEEISVRRSNLIVPIQNRGEVTYLLAKNDAIQKDDRYIRFVGMANKNSKNVYGCFTLAIQKIDGKYYIANAGYSDDASVKNRDFYKEP